MNDDNCNEAKVVLIEFMNAMNAWELKFYPLFRNEGRANHEDKAKEELTEIFERWCHPTSGSRDRLVAINCSEPPEYEIDGRTITACSEIGSVVVCDITQTTGLKSKFKFSLKKTKTGWKVAKKERGRYDGKWQTGGF